MQEDTYMEKILIGNQIRRFRREKGFTQAQLAELAHISEKTLSDIENDKINPRYKSIISISRALEVPIGVLSTEIETCGKGEFIDYLSDYVDDLKDEELQYLLKVIQLYKTEKGIR